MSNPETHDEPDELDLDPATVRDLDPSAEEADSIRGGVTVTICGPTVGCQPPSHAFGPCLTNECVAKP